MTFRTWLMVGWGVLLLLGAAVIFNHSRPDPAGLVAARDLPANTLLQGGDVRAISAGVQYLTRPIKVGEAIAAGDIAAFPSLSFAAGELPLALPVARSAVKQKDVNAGTNARVCKPGAVVLASAPVKALFCPSAGGDCIAIAIIAAGRLDDFAKALDNASRPFLEPTQNDPPCE